MDRVGGNLIVSATDLVGHLACGYLSVLDLETLDSDPHKPPAMTPSSRSSSVVDSNMRPPTWPGWPMPG